MEIVLLILGFLAAILLATVLDTLAVWAAFWLLHAAIPAVPELTLVHAFWVGCALSLIGMVFKGLND